MFHGSLSRTSLPVLSGSSLVPPVVAVKRGPRQARLLHGVGERAVSICGSARITSRAHEAGVETHPDFRGRGHAVKVVAAWARAVREDGRIPLYSTSWENEASRDVARKLGLVQYGVTFHVT